MANTFIVIGMKHLLRRLPVSVNPYIANAMEVDHPPEKRRTGRPLSFDREIALDAAMRLFWQHGFEGTSIADLTRAMRITPPSLYAAFGDKRALFREAVDHYLGGAESIIARIEAAPTARDAAHDLLSAAAQGNTGQDTPPGCLLASSIVSSSSSVADLREELAQIRRAIEQALAHRIARDISIGALPVDGDAEFLAGHIFAVVQGMSTMAKDGASRKKLMGIVDQAVVGWPGAL